MSLNEKIFHWIWNKKEGLRNKKQRESESLYGIALEKHRYRFSLMAFALAGRWLEISTAEEAGGFINDRLYLPRILNLTQNREQNLTAFFYRIAFTISSRNLGFSLPESFALSSERRLIDFALIPTVEKKMQTDFPGLWEKVPELKKHILSERPAVKHLSGPNEFMEALNQHFLGKSFEINDGLSLATKAYLWLVKLASGEIPKTANLASQFQQGLPFQFSQEGILPLWGRIALVGSHQGKVEPAPVMKMEQTEIPQGTEKEKKPTEAAKLLEFDEDSSEQMPVQLVIEQLQTLEKFLGGKKTVDASDELESHSQALEEVDVREIFRSKKQSQSIFRSDIALSPAEIEMKSETASENTYFYDEWDHKKKAYRKRWCQVVENKIKSLKDETKVKEDLLAIRKKYRRETADLKRRLDSLLMSRSWKNRQTEGDEIDIDQVVDRHASLKSGHTPTEKLYRSKRKSERDVAVLLLLDTSLSTGSWIGGREVMTIAKESLIMIHQAFSDLSNRVAMAGFYSHTRTRCTYLPIKDFKEGWNLKTGQKLLSLNPAGYTRIGPALRHSVEKMKNKSATRKAILLITDGKPTDYDAYEGKYGIEDVRQAVREAGAKDIGVFGLAIDHRARTYFPRMFGQRHFSILGDPKQLPEKLLKWYMQLFYGD